MALFNLFGALGLDSSLQEIKSLIQGMAKPLMQVTGNGSSRLSVDVNALTGTVGTVSTVTTVTTVNTVSNQLNIGGVNAFELQKANSMAAFSLSVRPHI